MGCWAGILGLAWLLGLGYLDRSRQIGRLELNSPNRLIRRLINLLCGAEESIILIGTLKWIFFLLTDDYWALPQ